MKIKFLNSFVLFTVLAVFCSAQQAGVASPGQKVSGETAEALRKLPGSSDIPLQKYDATAIVEIPDMSPSQDKPAGDFAGMDNGAEGSSSGQGGTSDLAPVQDPQSAALQPPVENALSTPLAQEELQQAEEQAENQKKAPNKKKQHFGLKLDGNEEDEDDGDIPPGTLAVYIDVEEAFNNNPWTIKARKNIKIDLEATQVEYVQMQTQLQELKNKLSSLNKDLAYYIPYYQNVQYIPALGDRDYPKFKTDGTENISKELLFSSSASQVDSPLNIPLKIQQLKSAIKDTKKSIIEKEAFLLDYRELSKEEILSRQDYIVQQILKQIYSGIKEYAAVRNIGIVVDKKDLIFGKPLNVTPEFIKWMKSYNKKYIKEHGDLL